MQSSQRLPMQKPAGKLLFEKLDDEKEVERLLKQGVDPNYTVSDGWWKGWTPLAYAVDKQKLELVQLLLEHGAESEQCYPGTQQSLFSWSFDRIYEPHPLRAISQPDGLVGDYRIPFLLLEFERKAPKNRESSKTTEAIYSICHSNPFLNKDDKAIKMLARSRYCLSLLWKHFSYKEMNYRCWTWQEICLFIKSLSPTLRSKYLEEDMNKALQFGEWEVVHEFIKQGVKIPEKIDGMNTSPLVIILKNTNPFLFLLESDSSHQNPTRCFEAILAKGFDPNETFQHDGKTWSLLSWASYHKFFVAAKLLLKYGANPNQNIPGTTLPLSDSFPIVKAQELKSTDALIFTLQSENTVNESKSIPTGIDIHSALMLRINESIEIVKNKRINLQKELESSSAQKKRQILDFNEHFYKLQKAFLDKFEDKAANGEFEKLNHSYIDNFEKLKIELYQSEAYRARTRIAENKNLAPEVKGDIVKDYLDQVKAIIAECSIQFLDFTVTDEKSLCERHKNWCDNISSNRQEQKQVQEEYEKLSMDMHAKDQDLILEFQELVNLKNDLIANKELRQNSKLSTYFLKDEEFNRWDQNGFYPLHYACLLDDVLLGKKLIDKGAQKNLTNIKCPSQNKVYSMNRFVEHLRPDLYRLYRTASIIEKEGCEGIVYLGIPKARQSG